MKSNRFKAAFRVDASELIGTGHLMRCLTLADEIKSAGGYNLFVSRYMPDYLCDLISDHGHDLKLIDSVPYSQVDSLAHSHWLGTSQSQDAKDSLNILKSQQWDWLIVDHYAIGAEWQSLLKLVASKILVIDDIADRKHDCDLLLDQNFYSNMGVRYNNKVPSSCELALGPTYALLRKEFKMLHNSTEPRRGSVKNILIFFGGIDSENCTEKAIHSVFRLNRTEIKVDVIIGIQHPCREKIEVLCKQYGYTIHIQTNKIAELIAAADFSIGASGSATWERCALGLPTLMVSIADNQIEIAKNLDRLGGCVYFGPLFSLSISILTDAIARLLDDLPKLALISSKSYSLVDGLGAQRICKKLGI